MDPVTMMQHWCTQDQIDAIDLLPRGGTQLSLDDRAGHVDFLGRPARHVHAPPRPRPDAWNADPEVVAVSYTVHQCNIDKMEEDHGA